MILGHEPLNGRTGHEAGRQLLKKLYLQQTGEDLPPIGKGEWGNLKNHDSPAEKLKKSKKNIKKKWKIQ